ncbi:MAG: hypothetical protein QOE83_187 [Actinomycetota bacterium]|jgi:hypothetical protein|nr:hypothetical protein [Actinomycetota bacterium]
MESDRDSNQGASADAGHPQPEAAEVESARLLANEAHDELARDGMSDDVIRRAADAFVASGNGGDVGRFIEHAREQWSGSAPAHDPTPEGPDQVTLTQEVEIDG